MTHFNYRQIAEDEEKRRQKWMKTRRLLKETIEASLSEYSVLTIDIKHPPGGEELWNISIMRKPDSPPPLGIHVTDGMGTADKLR